jgi:hypothetical protein
MKINKKKEKKRKLIIFIISFLLILKINYFGNNNFKQKLVLHLGKNCYHIHHWFYLLILLIFTISIRYMKFKYFEMILIIFTAFISEGLMFNDWLKFYHKLCNNI